MAPRRGVIEMRCSGASALDVCALAAAQAERTTGAATNASTSAGTTMPARARCRHRAMEQRPRRRRAQPERRDRPPRPAATGLLEQARRSAHLSAQARCRRGAVPFPGAPCRCPTAPSRCGCGCGCGCSPAGPRERSVSAPRSRRPERRRAAPEGTARRTKEPAATYSPGPLRAKYHRRCGA